MKYAKLLRTSVLQSTFKCLLKLVQDKTGKKFLFMYRNVNAEADSINALKIIYVLYIIYTWIDR